MGNRVSFKAATAVELWTTSSLLTVILLSGKWAIVMKPKLLRLNLLTHAPEHISPTKLLGYLLFISFLSSFFLGNMLVLKNVTSV